jgi:hypothetical protein
MPRLYDGETEEQRPRLPDAAGRRRRANADAAIEPP